MLILTGYGCGTGYCGPGGLTIDIKTGSIHAPLVKTSLFLTAPQIIK